MAHARLDKLNLRLAALVLTFASGCGPREGDRTALRPEAAPNREVFAPERILAHFHSKRFLVTLALPDGRAWQINDHAKTRLVAVHARTQTQLELEAFDLGELASRQKCRDAAFSRLEIDPHTHSVIEQAVVVGPEAYDAELQSTLEASREKQEIRAHFFAFAGFLRHCITMHVVTIGKPETLETLSDRLVTFRTQVWAHLEVDDFLAVPREKRTPIRDESLTP